MKIISPIPRKRGRIEIIPLIDIMFFLLAAFMVVSIHKIKVKSLPVSLPTDVPVAQLETKENFISISVDATGHVALDKEFIRDGHTLLTKLQAIYASNKDQKFLISADKDARNGDVIAILGKLRQAGFQRVAFNLKGDSGAISAPVPGADSGAPEPPPSAPEAPPPTTAPTPPSAAAPAPPAPNVAPASPAAPPTAPPSSPAPPAAPAPH